MKIHSYSGISRYIANAHGAMRLVCYLSPNLEGNVKSNPSVVFYSTF
jgi:hypothetical protein